MRRIGIDEVVADLQRRMDEVRQYQDQMATVEGVGEAVNGLVRVTVGAGGVVRDIALDPRAMRLDSQTLRESLLQAIQLAGEDASAQAAVIGAELNSQIGAAIDQAGLTKEMDRLMAGFSRNLDDIQQNYQTLLGKMRQQNRPEAT